MHAFLTKNPDVDKSVYNKSKFPGVKLEVLKIKVMVLNYLRKIFFFLPFRREGVIKIDVFEKTLDLSVYLNVKQI